MPGGTPTKDNHAKRQSVVTQVITASASAAPSAAAKKAFPIAVAVPALVGGMALAIAAFLLYWWIAKRRRREKRLRWERHQAFLAKKRNQTPRPSVSTQRANSGQSSGGAKSPINEKKELVPPVPALHKHASQNQTQYAYGKPEQGYGFSHQEHYGQSQPQQYQQYEQAYHNYAPQPTQMDHYRGDQAEHATTAAQQYTYADPQPQHAPVTLEQPIAEPEPAPTAEPSRPAKSSSRSAARVAAAEKAAEASHGDINTRYQPKKPSPLAVKAAAERQQQQQQQQQQYLSADPYAASAGRQVSGEWGVALGSPTHDAGFAQQQVHGQRESYSNDPYLVQNQQSRGKSGMYSHDPYAAYHGDEVEEVDYHQVAADMEGKKRSNWV